MKKQVSQKIKTAMAGVMANPVMKHMREIAYASVQLTRSKNDIANLTAAELKRLRKQQKRIKEFSSVKDQ